MEKDAVPAAGPPLVRPGQARGAPAATARRVAPALIDKRDELKSDFVDLGSIGLLSALGRPNKRRSPPLPALQGGGRK